MVQLNVIIVGTSPAETLRLEGALQQTQYLHRFKYISLELAVNGSPNWNSWDLLIARYQEETGAALLSLLAPVLHHNTPPVLFLVDPFDPLLFMRLINHGARRVIPMDLLEQSLEPSLASLFGPEVREKTASRKEPRKQNGKRLGQGETGLGDRQKSEVFEDSFAYLFRSSPIGNQHSSSTQRPVY